MSGEFVAMISATDQLNVSTTSRSESKECLSRWHHRIHDQTGAPHSVIRRVPVIRQQSATPSLKNGQGHAYEVHNKTSHLRTTNSDSVGSTLPFLSLFLKRSVGYYDPGT